MGNKKALITGINGQDGSYLAELLLEKGYEVWGTVKRNSVSETQSSRIEHLRSSNKINLEYADLTDMASLVSVLQKVKPDEIYNLAAQSHVRVSFDQPIYTANVTGVGTLNLLESVRLICPEAKVYQASSSEMFGNNIDSDGYQRETTPMGPVSPYGCAKVFSYNICRNYRNSYGMKIWNGVLFNHECISENSPVIIKYINNSRIDIVKAKFLKSLYKKGKNKQQWLDFDYQIWDGYDFVDVKCITATKRPKKEDDFTCVSINTRNGITETTKHHNMLIKEGDDIKKVKARNIKQGDELLHGNFPKNNNISSITKEESKLIGLLVSDGYVSEEGSIKFSNNNVDVLNEVSILWERVTLGVVSKPKTYESGYGGDSTSVRLNGNNEYGRYLRNQIYDKDGYKKIPERILNTNKENQLEFLRGYNLGDGLKSNPCVYEFKNFKTNSSILAQGLLFIVNNITNQNYNITYEVYNDKPYYSINLLTDRVDKTEPILELVESGLSQRKISQELSVSRSTIRKVIGGVEVYTDSHLKKEPTEVKKIVEIPTQPEWVFDIEVETGRIMSGVGNVVISNSPRRGTNFVTNKVVKAAVRIKLGLQDKLYLGNLDATRDWGHAQDYCQAMWLMLQTDKPDDYVCATGISHSVRELCEYTFNRLGLDYNDYVMMDEKHLRPEELHDLKGDSSKLRNELGWKPKYTFETMLDEMIQYWLDYYKK